MKSPFPWITSMSRKLKPDEADAPEHEAVCARTSWKGAEVVPEAKA